MFITAPKRGGRSDIECNQREMSKYEMHLTLISTKGSSCMGRLPLGVRKISSCQPSRGRCCGNLLERRLIVAPWSGP